MTTANQNRRSNTHKPTGDLDEIHDLRELSDLEDAWLDKLRIQEQARASYEYLDYVELLTF